MKTKTKGLTPREDEVIRALAKGLLYKEIGEQLEITIDTVKKHCKSIFKKLGVRNRTEAVNVYNGTVA